MTDHTPDRPVAIEPVRKFRWWQRGILWVVCALIIGLYAMTAHTGALSVLSLDAPSESSYNWLVDGFRAGQLSLKKDVPAEFAQLDNPYDPTANRPFRLAPSRLHDLSYFKGRLFIYFGPTPALLLFWPYVVLTGHYLLESAAVTIFCAAGFLASVGLLLALWRRYFSQISFGVVIAGVLALGLANGVLILLAHCEVYEVAISCAAMLTMLTLAALWRAIHEPERRARWLGLASLTYGLAVAARPNLLFGAAILLVPVIQARRERRPIGRLLPALAGPITLIGLGVLLYNYQRFGNPFEFGQSYQLSTVWAAHPQLFHWGNMWSNFRVYFLEPVGWRRHFPFVYTVAIVPASVHHTPQETPFGILANIPLVWLALAAPLAWRGRPTGERRTVGAFLAVVALSFAVGALTILSFHYTSFRYEIDFLPALILLAVMGILGLERALAGNPFWRRVGRWGWGGLLSFSVAIVGLMSCGQTARTENEAGRVLAQLGRVPESIRHFRQAVRYEPDSADGHNNLGIALLGLGRVPEAAAEFAAAVQFEPDLAEARNNLGIALFRLGKVREGGAEFAAAVQLKPDFAEAHSNLGMVLLKLGKVTAATAEFATVVQLQPENAEARDQLARLQAAPSIK